MRSRSTLVRPEFDGPAHRTGDARATAGRLSWLAWAFAASFVAIYAGYTLHYSDYNNDDLDNFLAVRSHGFWAYLALPLNIHWVPLHRLLSWLVYHVAPMRFGPAVLVLMACHVGSLVYLHATLRLTQAGRSGLLVLCCYASCVLVLYGIVWWANAQHRLPHVLLLSAAIYHYLRYLDGGGKAHASLVFAACLLDYGFYEKAVLIPGYLLVLGACVHGRELLREPLRFLWLPGMLLIVSMSYVLVYLHLMPLQVSSSPGLTLRATWEFLRVLAGGLIGVLFSSYQASQSEEAWHWWLIAIFWIAAFAASIRWAPRAIWLWAAMLLCVLVDYLPVAVSSRIAIFGLGVPYYYRYHYETVYLVAVFAGLLLARIHAARSSRPDARRAGGTWSGLLVVGVYATAQILALVRAHGLDAELRMYARAHDYLHHLRKGLSHIAEPQPAFENTEVPHYMSVFQFVRDTNTLLPLFVPDARLGVSQGPRYRVGVDGHVERLP